MFRAEIYHVGLMYTLRRSSFKIALSCSECIIGGMSYDMHYTYLAWRGRMELRETIRVLEQHRNECDAQVLCEKSLLL